MTTCQRCGNPEILTASDWALLIAFSVAAGVAVAAAFNLFVMVMAW